MAATAMVDGAEVALVDLAGADLRRVLTRANLLGAIGDLTGPALVAAVGFTGASWRAAFGAGAALLAAYALVLALSPLPRPNGAGPDDEPSTPRAVLLAVARDRRVWLVGALSLLLAPFDEAFIGFAIALLDEVRGTSAGVANLVAVVGLSGGLFTFTVLAPRLGDAADDRRLVAWCGVAAGGSALVVALVPVVPLVAAAAFVASVALNVGWLAVQHRMLVLRPGQAGTTKAVVSNIELAAFGVPIAIGAIADRAGLPTAVATYVLLGAALALLAFVGLRERNSSY